MGAIDVITFGQLKDGHKVMEKFKAELPSSISQKGTIHRTRNTSQGELLNMIATIDYFREIFDHTVRIIINLAIDKEATRYIRNVKENIRFVVTVPTQWNNVQRDIMRNVAREAGLISEKR